MKENEVKDLISDLDTAVASFTSISERMVDLSVKMESKKKDISAQRSAVVKDMLNKTLALDEQAKALTKSIRRCKRISKTLTQIFK